MGPAQTFALNSSSLDDLALDKRAPAVVVAGSGDAMHMSEKAEEIPTTRAQEVLEEIKQETALHEGEDDVDYPKAWKLAVIMIALCLAVFCMALDNTIIATAIPKITDQFKALDDVAWYGSAYLLCTCAFQLFFGRLYTFFSIKRIFLGAIVLFEIGSLICGTAPTSVALIVGRAIAGLGAAGLFSGCILIVAHTVPLRKRPIYTGFIGAMYGIASVAGPLMGGAFTDHLTWRWCFYINLPFGAVTIFFIAIFFKSPDRAETSTLTWRQKILKLDLPGTAVFVPAIICLLLALQWGGSKYPWSDAKIIALFVVFGVLIIIFVGIQAWQGDDGTVPPRIFFQRSVLAASWFVMCLGASFFLLVYYLPIWFQAIKGTTATQSGINSLPLILGVTILSIISGFGVTTLGYYTPWIIASSVFISVGTGLITTFRVGTDSGKWIGYQAIAGAGFGMGIQNPLIAVQTVLPLKDVSTGAAIIIFSQTLGGALFIAVGQNVFLNQLIKNVHTSIPDFPIKSILTTGATTLKDAISPAQYPQVLSAYNKTLDQTYYVALAMGCVSIIGAVFIEWKSVKGKKMEIAAA